MRKAIPVFEFVEVQLLVVLGEQLAEEVAVGEVSLEVGDFLRQLHFVIDPLLNEFHLYFI